MSAASPHCANRFRSLAALAAGLLAVGCAESSDAEVHVATLDLLTRRPSIVFESQGELRPDPVGVFKPNEGEGWGFYIGSDPAGRPVGEMVEPEAALYFTPSAPKDRELTFDACAADGVPPDTPVAVQLNGVHLGAFTPTTEPGTYSLAAPAAAWLNGRNRLSFHMEADALPIHADHQPRGLLLASVAYEARLLVRRDTTGLRLPDTTGAAFHIEQRGIGELSLAARAESAGELTIAVNLLDPTTSAPLPESPAPRQIALDAGHLHTETLAIPRRFDGIVELTLDWQAPAGGDLIVTELARTESSAGAPPPIVLISIDTLAAQHLSLYGYGLETSPHIDAWAQQAGTTFEHARANAPWTMPSFAALMTGYYPSSARIKPNLTSGHYAATLPHNRWSLAESLRAAGYHTGAFVDSPNVGSVLGFDQGFDVFDESATHVPHGERGGGIELSATAALDWLDGLPEGEPYFLFLHANNVHGPYVPDEEDVGHFQDQLTEVGRELVTGGQTDVYRQIPDYLKYSALTGFDPYAPRLPADPLRAAYDETIRSLDRRLGAVFAALDERGVFEEAIIVFTADHGEAFDEHDKMGHSLLYDEVLHVPLVVRLPPALRTDSTPARVATGVQLVDVYPTLFELVGLRTERRDWHGRSLVPALRGAELAPTPLYAEGGIMTQSAIVHGDWKLVERFPTQAPPWTMLSDPTVPRAWLDEHLPGILDVPLSEATLLEFGARTSNPFGIYRELRELLDEPVLELYNLARDPDELVNLAQAEPARLAELRALLEQSKALLDAAMEQESAAQVEISAEHRANLEVLGY